MTSDHPSENVVLSVSGGIMALTLLFALGADILQLDRTGCRVLFAICAAVLGLASIVRYVRLHRAGVVLLFFRNPAIRDEQSKYLLWLCAAALLGAYSTYELLLGGFFVGMLGGLAALSSMLVLVRALIGAALP